MRRVLLLVVLGGFGCSTPGPTPWTTLPADLDGAVRQAQAQWEEAAGLPFGDAARTRRLEHAAGLLESVIAARPQCFRAHAALQDVRLAVRPEPKAPLHVPPSAAAEAAETDPVRLALWARFASGDPARARALLERAAEADPGFPWAPYLLAFLDWQAEDYDAGLGHVQAALDVDGTFEEAVRLQAELLDASGRAGEALRAFEDLVERWPEDRLLRYRLARLLVETDDRDDAERAVSCLDRVLAGLPRPGTSGEQELRRDASLVRAVALEGMNRPREAIKAYDQVLDDPLFRDAATGELDPGCLKALYNKGLVLERLGEVEAALQAFERYQRLAARADLDADDLLDVLFWSDVRIKELRERLEAAAAAPPDPSGDGPR